MIRRVLLVALALALALQPSAALVVADQPDQPAAPQLIHTTAMLSQPRSGAAGIVVGNTAVFGGDTATGPPSAAVDIYDTNAETWSAAQLSVGRIEPSVTVVRDVALVYGGI